MRDIVVEDHRAEACYMSDDLPKLWLQRQQQVHGLPFDVAFE